MQKNKIETMKILTQKVFSVLDREDILSAFDNYILQQHLVVFKTFFEKPFYLLLFFFNLENVSNQKCDSNSFLIISVT